uniref:Beta-1,6-N-acetylglucosaminyltransferase n=1 Tax=Parastrongyloides trichosuri TaxID=131310 RepID=A0A0N4ZH91_PARTI
MNSSGMNVILSSEACYKILRNYKWKYIFFLANHDFPLKTNSELVKILKTFEDTPDFHSIVPPRVSRVNEKLDWTFRGLNLFKYNKLLKSKILRKNITLAKGYSTITISRKTIDYIYNNFNLKIYQSYFLDDNHKYGNDELYWQTLFSNYEVLKIPGTIPSHCINTTESYKSFTRYTHWNFKHKDKKICLSNNARRHGICLLGVEYLNTFEDLVHLFANKMMEWFDLSAIDCWSERLFNRTYNQKLYKKLDLLPYKNKIQIRFQNYLKKSFNVSGFKCDGDLKETELKNNM